MGLAGTPWMAGENAANEVAVGVRVVEGVGGSVDADECLAGPHPLEQAGEVWNRQLARRIDEHHAVETGERLGRERPGEGVLQGLPPGVIVLFELFLRRLEGLLLRCRVGHVTHPHRQWVGRVTHLCGAHLHPRVSRDLECLSRPHGLSFHGNRARAGGRPVGVHHVHDDAVADPAGVGSMTTFVCQRVPQKPPRFAIFSTSAIRATVAGCHTRAQEHHVASGSARNAVPRLRTAPPADSR